MKQENIFRKGRLALLLLLLAGVTLTQQLPEWGACYARHLYPAIATCLSSFSRYVPFAMGDLFIAACVGWLLAYPWYACKKKHLNTLKIAMQTGEFLAWIYVWFYLAWGLNYSQPNFYRRTGIVPASYTEEDFLRFARHYVDSLNATYTAAGHCRQEQLRDEIVGGYHRLSRQMGIHAPFHNTPRAKTMLFTPLLSKVGVMGSMAPFFCEFTLNGDLLPSQYPATYAHELAHLQGITSEAEANFYAYQICTRSQEQYIRFSGYLSILPHLLSNAHRLLSEADFRQLVQSIDSDVVRTYESNRAYWRARYSPTLGKIQHWFYELYLKGNKIPDGRKNYSQVVGLLLSWEQDEQHR